MFLIPKIGLEAALNLRIEGDILRFGDEIIEKLLVLGFQGGLLRLIAGLRQTAICLLALRQRQGLDIGFIRSGKRIGLLLLLALQETLEYLDYVEPAVEQGLLPQLVAFQILGLNT